jgi:hypothetical protein
MELIGTVLSRVLRLRQQFANPDYAISSGHGHKVQVKPESLPRAAHLILPTETAAIQVKSYLPARGVCHEMDAMVP